MSDYPRWTALRMLQMVLVASAMQLAPMDALAQDTPQAGGASAPRQPSPAERSGLEFVDFLLRMQVPADPAELSPQEMLGFFFEVPLWPVSIQPRPQAPIDHYDCIERRNEATSDCDRVYQDAIAECDRIHAAEEEKIIAWYKFRIDFNRTMRESVWKRKDQEGYEKAWRIKLGENDKRRDAGYQKAAEERDQCHDSAIEDYYDCVRNLPSPATP